MFYASHLSMRIAMLFLLTLFAGRYMMYILCSIRIECEKTAFYVFWTADEVYLKDDVLRDEYVLSEEGLMWRGSHNRQKEVMWKYGQFQKNMLEASFLLLLKIRRLALIYCNDPIQVSRNLSAAVSCVNYK